MNTFSPVSKFIFISACFVVMVAGMKQAEDILVPFLLSLFIAVICSPMLAWLKKRGLPTGFAILVIISMVVCLGVGIGVIVGASITSFRADLPDYQQRLSEMSASLFISLESFGLNLSMGHFRESFDPSAALSLAGSTLASFGNLMTNFLLIMLTVVFILAEEIGFSDKVRLGNPKSAEKTLMALRRFTTSVNRYMALKTDMSMVTGIIIMIWLKIQGVEYFILWGLLAFLLNYVPTLGSILASVPAVLLSLVQLGVGDAVVTALGFLVVNFVVGNVIEPRTMGRGLDLSTLVVFLSLVFWGWVLGPVGMLLSVPLTMTIKIALESFDETRWLGIMLGSGKSVTEFADPETGELIERLALGDFSEHNNEKGGGEALGQTKAAP